MTLLRQERWYKTYHKFKIFIQSCRYIYFSSNSRYIFGKLIEFIGMRNVGEEEKKVINEQSSDITSSANNEGVLEEDLES